MLLIFTESCINDDKTKQAVCGSLNAIQVFVQIKLQEKLRACTFLWSEILQVKINYGIQIKVVN